MRVNFMKSAVSLVIAGTVLSGCVTTHSTGDAPLHSRNWPICTAAGAAVGAGIGAAGQTGAAVAGGAVAGAAAGTLICYAQDGDEDSDAVFDRRDRCEGTPAGTPVHHNGCPLVTEEPVPVVAETPPPVPQDEVIVLSDWGNVLFEFDKSNLTPAAVEVLDSILPKLMADDVKAITVNGHTDSKGTDRYNQGLSERRAASVVTYLVSQGVDAERISSQGFGESQPVAGNETDEGRAQNRRVEIAIDR